MHGPQVGRRSIFVVAAAAGGFTVPAAPIGPSMGGFATGLLSSLPLLAPRVGAVAALTLTCARACLMSTIRTRQVPMGAAPLPTSTSPLGE